MYTKNEASIIREKFWTTFGLYMKPIPTQEDCKVNWINYKTGIKNIRFTMNADQFSAKIAIEIYHPDNDIQQLYTNQFLLLKNHFTETMTEEWQWDINTADELGGNVQTLIYKEIKEVNVFNKNDWPMLITFFKDRIINLHEFWLNAKYAFEKL